MDRVERVLLRVAIGVVVVMLVRELGARPPERSGQTGGGSMVMGMADQREG